MLRTDQIKIHGQESANNSERDVESEALAVSINNLASNKTGDQAKNNPTDDTQWITSQDVGRDLQIAAHAANLIALEIP